MIVAEKERLFESVERTLANAEQRDADERDAGDLAAENAISAFNDESARLIGEMDSAILDGIDALNEELHQAQSDMEAAVDAAEAELELYLKGRLADWEEKYDWEKQQALYQRDSYWRYHLLKLAQAKDDAVRAAVNQARSDFQTAMLAEEAESTDTRNAARTAFVAFTGEARVALLDAIELDRQALSDEIEERERTLDEFLDAQLAQIMTDLADCLEAFRLALKELYNYIEVEQYDVEENLRVAPYTDYQHKNFLHKFGFWLEGQLNGLDGQAANMGTAAGAEAEAMSDLAS
jgi:hypothetical protein